MEYSNLLKEPRQILSNILNIVKAYKALVILFIFVSMVMSYSALIFVSDKYISECSLLVTLGRENMEVPVTVERGDLYSNGVRQEDISTEIQIMSSRALIEEVIDGLGIDAFFPEAPAPENIFQVIKVQLKGAVKVVKTSIETAKIKLRLSKEYTEREKLILLLSSSVHVSQLKESNIINMQIKFSDKDLSILILNEYLKQYFTKRIQLRQNTTIKKFYGEIEDNLKVKLIKLENDKKIFLNKNNLSSIQEQQSVYLHQIAELQQEVDDTRFEIRQLKLNAVKTSTEPVDKMDEKFEMSSESSIETIKKRLTDANMKYFDTKYYLVDDSFELKKLERDISYYNQLLTNLLTSKISQLRSQINRIKGELQALNTKNDWVKKIEREIGIVQEQYLEFYKKREQASISLELDEIQESNIIVLNPPLKPIKPASPARAKLIVISAILGFILAMLLAFVLEYLNATVYSAADLEDIEDLHHLGNITLKYKKRTPLMQKLFGIRSYET